MYTCLLGNYFKKHKETTVQFRRGSGSSAGAIVAAYALTEAADHRFIEIYQRELARDPKMYVLDFARILLNETLPPNAHEICENRLFVAVNEISYQGLTRHVICNFRSRDDLIDCILASCALPFITMNNSAYSWRGGYYIDGGFPCYFTDNQRPCFKINLIRMDYSIYYTACVADPNVHHLAIKGLEDFLDWYLKGKKSRVFSLIQGAKKPRAKRWKLTMFILSNVRRLLTLCFVYWLYKKGAFNGMGRKLRRSIVELLNQNFLPFDGRYRLTK